MNRLGRRTNADFNKHNYTSFVLEHEDYKIRVDRLQVGDSKQGLIEFINTPNGLAVFGDFGNWSFDREFTPHQDASEINDDYWIEKLELYSNKLEFWELDKDLNRDCLDELALALADEYNYGLEGDELDDGLEWIREAKSLLGAGSPLEYLHCVYHECPYDFLDTEMIPNYKKTPRDLEIIFDAFEEMCLRLKESEATND